MFWNDEKSFGFIAPDQGGKQVFAHINAFQSNNTPEVGDIVEFVLSLDRQNRLCASQIIRTGEKRLKAFKAKKKSGKGTKRSFFAVIFLLIVAMSVAMGKIPSGLLGIYVLLSFITFVFYAHDKSAAKKGSGRTAESVLHTLALLGGWPGAMVAQQALRHKSKKSSFQLEFWITVILNCAVFLWFFTSVGSAFLAPIL
ncbi:MAG: DUF1294 domain-containing protein [Arenicella sp.]